MIYKKSVVQIALYIFKKFDLLFPKYFFIYKPIYFGYKNLADIKKIKMIKQFVKPGMVVLDIGANIGFYTLLLSNLVGENGIVYSFEPDPINFKLLKKNCGKRKNIILVKAAVGEKTGKINLYKSNDLNVDHQTFDSGENRKKIQVKVWAIDDYLENSQKIDFIKIDVQGFEFFSMKGLVKTIKRSKRVLLISEFWPHGLNMSGVKPKNYLTSLRKMGFKISFFEKDIRKRNFNDENFYCDFYGIKSNKLNDTVK